MNTQNTPHKGNTPHPAEMRVLDSLLALNLDVSLWSARKKLTLEDFGNVELPPDDLATLGSKRIAPPESLRIFGTLKARAFNYLDRHGVRFMSGWAIPEEKAADIMRELMGIRDEFMVAKEQFLVEYHKTIEDWITKHKEWGNIIASSVVSPDYVRARMDFKWQMYKVAPLMQHDDSDAIMHAGLTEEVENLGNTLFDEISRTANDIWNRVYAGKTEVTHKALSPLKTLHNKLMGLSFVEPHVAPVGDIINTALQHMPKRGPILGDKLLTLQGLVCLLRDTEALLNHAQLRIQGTEDASLLNALLQHSQPIISTNDMEENTEILETLPMPDLPPVAHIPSMGLW